MANSGETNTKVTNEPILSIDQVMENNLSPGTTDTPVKLLGEEDGCVGWYDVETSQQIKAFRYGEFDECIEKANAIPQALQRERAQKVEDGIEQEIASPSVPKISSLIQLDLNRSPDYNELISLPDVSGCDRVKCLFEDPDPATMESGSSSMHACGASEKLQVGCQVNQVEAQSYDVEVLDDDFSDIQMRGSSDNYIGSDDDDDDDAPKIKNYGDRRSRGGPRGPYKLRAKPRASTWLAQTCPALEKLRRVSSSHASEHTSSSVRILEFKKIKNLSLHCVPVKLIQSRLNEAL